MAPELTCVDESSIADCERPVLALVQAKWHEILGSSSRKHKYANVLGDRLRRYGDQPVAHRSQRARETRDRHSYRKIGERWHRQKAQKRAAPLKPLLSVREVPILLANAWLGKLSRGQRPTGNLYRKLTSDEYDGFSREEARQIFQMLQSSSADLRLASAPQTERNQDSPSLGMDLSQIYNHRVILEHSIRASSHGMLSRFRDDLKRRSQGDSSGTFFDDKIKHMLSLIGDGATWPWGTPVSGCESQESCDYITTSVADIDQHLRSGSSLRPVPHVVRGMSPDGDDVEQFLKLLQLRAGDSGVEVQDYGEPRSEDHSKMNKIISTLELRERIEEQSQNAKGLAASSYFPLNLLNLHGLRQRRQTLIPPIARNQGIELGHQWAHEATSGTGKSSFSSKAVMPQFLMACADFELYAQHAAFSGPHVDLLGYTEIHCHFGHKAWLVRTISENDSSSLRDFYEHGDEWCPSDEFKLILLRPGDSLLMPPGALLVHAPVTIDDCLMSGRMYIDVHQLPWLGRHVARLIKHEQVTNEELPHDFDMIWKNLVEQASKNPAAFDIAESDRATYFAELESSDSELRQLLSCVCGSNKRCGPNCSCRSRGLFPGCSSWCHDGNKRACARER